VSGVVAVRLFEQRCQPQCWKSSVKFVEICVRTSSVFERTEQNQMGDNHVCGSVNNVAGDHAFSVCKLIVSFLVWDHGRIFGAWLEGCYVPQRTSLAGNMY
jgi:hypothetical protein